MKIIGIIIGPLLLFIWLIINIIYVFRKIRNIIREKNKDITLVVKCEKCKNEHNATIDELLSTYMSKNISRTMSAEIGVLGASVTKYYYFAKKIYCPTCKKKTWSEIKDYNKLAIKNTKIMMPLLLKCLGSLLIGGAIIIFVIELFT